MEAGNLDDTTGAPRDAEACRSLCPQLVQETLGLIGTKWSPPLLLALSHAQSAVGFAELKRRVDGITAKELSRHLKALVGAGAVMREVHPTVPPRVEYSLTELGRRLVGSIAELADWGVRLRAMKKEPGV